uniref:thiamine pyrophosphate-dependent enzyme n=1 Tax=Pseudomonas aeruginosa TaxID=287 RepID=UPI001FC98A92
TAIWQIGEALDDTAHWDFTRLLAIREANEAQVAEGADDPRFPLYPQRLVADVRRALPSQGIVALDNGMYKIWFARNYKAHMPNTVLLDNALATMGAGLPSAMAAHLVYPDRPIVAVCGDGGFMMNSQELETAVRLKMNLTVIILRDNGYGMIRWKQSNMGFADFGLDYGNPDFVHYAEAYGAHGHRVDSAEGFLPLLERCLGTPGVHVIDCPVDYSENDRILNVELRERALAV